MLLHKKNEEGLFQNSLDSFEAMKSDACSARLVPELSPIGSHMCPREVKIGPRGALLERLGLPDASWSGLGGLLERSWRAPGPNQSALERLLGAPRGT